MLTPGRATGTLRQRPCGMRSWKPCIRSAKWAISDVVDAILRLELVGFVTGEILHVDGGQSAGH